MKVLVAKLKILLLGLICLAVALLGILGASFLSSRHCFVIGAKSCTEQHILGEISALLLEKNSDIKVVRRFNLAGTAICFNALKTGSIDTYFEYTGTALLDILKEPLIQKPLYPHVKAVFEKKHGITWLAPLGFANQYALIARADAPFKKISDLKNYPKLRIAFDPEFSTRLEVDLLKNSYPLHWQSKLMDPILLYLSLAKDEVDVISGASTDGRLGDQRFRILKDDRHCLPKYEVAPIIKIASLERFPEVEKVFSLMTNAITVKEMARLNYQVEIERRSVQEVAAKFIAEVL